MSNGEGRGNATMMLQNKCARMSHALQCHTCDSYVHGVVILSFCRTTRDDMLTT